MTGPGAQGREPEPDDALGVVVFVIAGGDPPSAAVVERLPSPTAVVAADSGLDRALGLGLRPSLLVGDLDSVSVEGLRWARTEGVAIEAHPQDKDATDLELALTLAGRAADRIVVLGIGGGRADHELANMLLLAAPTLAGIWVEAYTAEARITVVRRRVALTGSPGSLVSLVPVHGAAEGVTTDGLRWPLRSETLAPGTSRGVSNEFLTASASVEVSSGVLLAVQPFAVSP
ncbi:MAG: thiamine diphosphokinase [Acidimicrobiales bacterium]|nr:thiamine diphosphokinase [Acidimicrobiales bacterium]